MDRVRRLHHEVVDHGMVLVGGFLTIWTATFADVGVLAALTPSETEVILIGIVILDLLAVPWSF